jgi:hypothetical protein
MNYRSPNFVTETLGDGILVGSGEPKLHRFPSGQTAPRHDFKFPLDPLVVRPFFQMRALGPKVY